MAELIGENQAQLEADDGETSEASSAPSSPAPKRGRVDNGSGDEEGGDPVGGGGEGGDPVGGDGGGCEGGGDGIPRWVEMVTTGGFDAYLSVRRKTAERENNTMMGASCAVGPFSASQTS